MNSVFLVHILAEVAHLVLELPAVVRFLDLRSCFLTISGSLPVVAAWNGQNLILESIASFPYDYKLFFVWLEKKVAILYR